MHSEPFQGDAAKRATMAIWLHTYMQQGADTKRIRFVQRNRQLSAT